MAHAGRDSGPLALLVFFLHYDNIHSTLSGDLALQPPGEILLKVQEERKSENEDK